MLSRLYQHLSWLAAGGALSVAFLATPFLALSVGSANLVEFRFGTNIPMVTDPGLVEVSNIENAGRLFVFNPRNSAGWARGFDPVLSLQTSDTALSDSDHLGNFLQRAYDGDRYAFFTIQPKKMVQLNSISFYAAFDNASHERYWALVAGRPGAAWNTTQILASGGTRTQKNSLDGFDLTGRRNRPSFYQVDLSKYAPIDEPVQLSLVVAAASSNVSIDFDDIKVMMADVSGQTGAKVDIPETAQFTSVTGLFLLLALGSRRPRRLRWHRPVKSSGPAYSHA